MKQLHSILFIAFLFSTVTSYSQIQKGAALLGGDLNFSSQSVKNENPGSKYNSNVVTVSPVLGKAVRDNVIVGGDLKYSYGKFESEITPGIEECLNAYGAGIFARKYHFLGKSGFSVFVQGRLGFLYTKNTSSNASVTYTGKQYNYSLNAYPGVSYSVSRKFQLETGVGNFLALTYQSGKTSSTGSAAVSKSRTFQLSTSLFNQTNFYVGFRILLNNTGKS